MAKFGWLRAVLSALIGIALGLIITSLINLFAPLQNLVWTLVAVCFSSLLSGLIGNLLVGRGKKEDKPKADKP